MEENTKQSRRPRLIHISDLHIRKDEENNILTIENLKSLFGDVERGDTLVITGDIVDDGLVRQYENAFDLLLPFKNAGLQILIAPGNHDYGPLGNFYLPWSRRHFEKLVKRLGANRPVVNSRWRILIIDTCLRTGSPFDFAEGRLGWWNAFRIKRFAKQCRKKGLFSVVACHHSPFNGDVFYKMQDRERFMRVTSSVVDMVVMGHEHKERILSDNRTAGRPGTGTIYSCAGPFGKPLVFTEEIFERRKVAG